MKNRRTVESGTRTLGFGLGLSLALAGAGAAAQIHLTETYPLKGKPTVIQVLDGGKPIAGATVDVLYRPNSEAAFLEKLGATDAEGRIDWSPTDAGLAQITARAPAGDQTLSLDVAIRWGRMPVAGAVILVAAAILLFGGAGAGFHLLVRGAPPPST